MAGAARKPITIDSPVTSVKGCAGARGLKLEKLGVRTIRDLLCWYPYRYIDLSQVSSCAAAPIGETVTVVGRLEAVKQKQPRPSLHIIEAAVVDDTGAMALVWFKQPWLINKLHPGDTVSVTGKVAFNYGMKQMTSPMLEPVDGSGEGPKLAMIPVHHSTEGLSASWMRRLVANAIQQLGDLQDPLPASIRYRHALMGRKAAFRYIHFPQTSALQQDARKRLAYEEVLRLQLEMLMRRRAELAGAQPVIHCVGAHAEAFRDAMPFQLTGEQEAAVADILRDMQAPRIMNRMLLGDVGTGKTVVAGFALCAAADSGFQAAMMAPTEVLAQQYGEKIGPQLERAGVSWAVLTGSTGAEERASILQGLADGSLDVVFGTHALIEPDVVFKHCSLVVIDEQHRFGVDQRAALRAKGEGSDLLVMTATPIPRTLALTIYGDLDTSYIRKRPANRPPVITKVISRENRRAAYEVIRVALKEGRQAYIVCPLVGLTRQQRSTAAEDGSMSSALRGEGEVANLKAAEEEAAFLGAKVFPQHRVGLLTGRMASMQKQQVMEDFRNGKIDVLVSTTVIEVGIDVPNATVMMIEDADRFGLSQLHQLRGRVGRGQHAGQVFLVADPSKDDELLQMRMSAMESTDDGFKLAEIDLASRREGDVLGSRQHGASHLKLVNVVDDAQLVSLAHEDARAILDSDPNLSLPEHVALAREIKIVFEETNAEVSKGA